MVATLIRLKRDLLVNSLRRSVGMIIGLAVALLYGLGAAVALSTAQLAVGADLGWSGDLREFSQSAPWLLTVIGGSAVTLLWLLIPLFVSGNDAVMDPKHFVTFGMPRRQLVVGLIVTGSLTPAILPTAIYLIGQMVLFRSDPLALGVAAATGPLTLLTVVLLSQAAMAGMSAWLGGRRSRDALAVLGLGLAMLAYPIVAGLQSAFAGLADALPAIAGVLAYTPLGAGVALPADALTGEWASFAVRLGIMAVTCGLCLAIIRAALVKLTERPRPASGSNAAGKPGRLGAFKICPASPRGAVAARALTYWFRDTRYGGSLVMLPALVVLAVFVAAQSESVWPLYGLAPFLGFVLGFSIHADVSYDNSAFALHVTSGLSGRADRIGRAAALLSFGLPLTAIAAFAPLAVGASAESIAIVACLGLASLCTGTGLSALVSARFTYPVPAPGASPFKQPPGAAGRSALVQGASMAAAVVVMAPELTLWIIWMVGGAGWVLPVLVAVSASKSLAVLVLGIRWGGALYDAAAPELFQRVSRYG